MKCFQWKSFARSGNSRSRERGCRAGNTEKGTFYFKESQVMIVRSFSLQLPHISYFAWASLSNRGETRSSRKLITFHYELWLVDIIRRSIIILEIVFVKLCMKISDRQNHFESSKMRSPGVLDNFESHTSNFLLHLQKQNWNTQVIWDEKEGIFVWSWRKLGIFLEIKLVI